MKNPSDELLAVTLKPCPFCGEAATVEKQGDHVPGRDGWFILCGGCGTTHFVEPTREEAIKVWNTRQNDPEKQALKEALRERDELLRAARNDLTSGGQNPRDQLSINHSFLTAFLARIDALISKGDAA